MITRGMAFGTPEEQERQLADIENEAQRKLVKDLWEGMKQAAAKDKSRNLKMYTNIRLNKELSTADLMYSPPQGALRAVSYAQLMKMN